jgi:hypothetical protein
MRAREVASSSSVSCSASSRRLRATSAAQDAQGGDVVRGGVEAAGREQREVTEALPGVVLEHDAQQALDAASGHDRVRREALRRALRLCDDARGVRRRPRCARERDVVPRGRRAGPRRGGRDDARGRRLARQRLGDERQLRAERHGQLLDERAQELVADHAGRRRADDAEDVALGERGVPGGGRVDEGGQGEIPALRAEPTLTAAGGRGQPCVSARRRGRTRAR